MATTDAQGIVTATYTYASGNTPDLITTSAATYRIVTDRLGSPRLIINTATGATVQHLDYDPFGNITTDTNPGFQPFGYTGGLADNDTGLLYLAARDYDPATGRFLTKDPTQFGGGDTNLYGYVGSDPVNYVDPTGLIFGIHCKTCREIASGTLHVVTAPGETIYNGFRREIYAYEHGCSYLDSIKYGIGGSIKGGFELALLLVAPEAEPEVVAAEDGAGALERASVSCGLSFSPDTLVLLADGESKPISELKVGDKVIGTDTKTGSSRARTVQAVLINHDTDLLDLVVIDRVGHRSIVHTTAKHPIWDDTTHRWVPAAHLPVKHLLHTADGRTMRVLEMVVPTITSGYMWDLTVEQDHDFYVKAGAAAILVHNCLGPVRLSEETRDTHILPLHGPGSPGLGSKLPATLEPEEYEAAANEVVRNSPIPSISQVGSHAHDWNGIRIWVDDLGNVLTMHGI
jgi:RHS repeat-associated protein